MSATSAVTAILQFGTSRFLQAHADLFLSEAMSRDQAVGSVTAVLSSGDASRRGRLAGLTSPDGYPVRIQGVLDGRIVDAETRVTSIRRALTTAEDWPEICRIAIEEAEIILSNTSDAGFLPQPEDEAPEFDQSMSYPAKLTQLLQARWRSGGRPLQVMPTELIARNGDTLHARVLDLASGLQPGLADWIASEVRFVNSLVDRIVSAPLEPAGAVAEPYALWAIEACPGLILPCIHPSVRVVEDLDHIEKMKLFILNLGHTWLVGDWMRRHGVETYVRDLMAEPVIRARLEAIYAEEILPAFAERGVDDAAAYAATTLDRFANPYLDHRLSDIAQNHREKLDRRIGAFLRWSGAEAPRLRAIMPAD